MGNCAPTTAFRPPAWCSSGASRTDRCTTNGRRGNRAARRKEKHTRKPPPLPIDIILEIVARADAVSIVRCAAASKYLRRHITDPAFLRRYYPADAGFVPSALLGMFQQLHGHNEPYRFVSMSPSNSLTLRSTPAAAASENDDFFDSCVPVVTSRAGLVILRGVDDRNLPQLCEYSPVTGRHYFLPPAALYDYSHALLAGDEDGNTGPHSFRLLVVDHRCRTQTFSSGRRRWGNITVTPGALSSYRRVQPAAVVLGGVAHWLCRGLSSGRYQVLAVRIGDGQAAAIGEVPESWRENSDKELLLVSTDGRQLGLLVSDVLVISLWTLSEDSRSWGDRRVVVNKISMLRSVKLRSDLLECSIGLELEWFGEASGTVAFKTPGTGIIVLNLRTKKITQFDVRYQPYRCCPYEVDLVSLLAGLHPF